MSLKNLLSLALISSSALAADVVYNGDAHIDYFGAFSDENLDSNRAHNIHHDITLSAEVKLNEGVGLNFGIRSVSLNQGEPSVGPRGPRPLDEAGDDLEQDAQRIDLDNAYFKWTFMPGATLRFGRFIHSAGSVNSYRPYRRTSHYSPLISDRTVLAGLGLEASDFFGYFGATGDSYDTYRLFLSYDAPLIESRTQTLNVEPILDFRLNDAQSRKWHLGLDNDYSSSWQGIEYSIHNVIGYMSHYDENTLNVLVEPTFKYKGFSLGLAYYYADLAVHPNAPAGHADPAAYESKNSILEQTSLPVQEFVYIEPYIPVATQWALGFPVSRHDPNDYVAHDEFWEYGLAVYAYPTNVAEFGAQIGIQDYSQSDAYFFTELYTEIHF